MSGDIMLFPETWEEYADAYSFTDTEQVYTNGAKLIPCFRVEQWLKHITEIKDEPTIKQDKVLCLGDLGRKCKHCTVKGETKHYCYCDIWGSVVNPRGWCNYGERDEKGVEK